MLTQAYDYLEECTALEELLRPLDDAAFARPTQFKGWTYNDVLGRHQYAGARCPHEVGILRHHALHSGRYNSRGPLSMKRTWTIIGVADVARSFGWYQALFGQSQTKPAHDYWGQILDTDGTVMLCLHQWGAHEHPSLLSPKRAEPGNGLLLFFRVDDFDESLRRARELVARLDEEPHLNPATGTLEFALRDPDGYHVMVSALDPP